MLALAIAALMLGVAGPAYAGSKPIVTPRLAADFDGTLVCTLANASEKKGLAARISIHQQQRRGGCQSSPAILGSARERQPYEHARRR